MRVWNVQFDVVVKTFCDWINAPLVKKKETEVYIYIYIYNIIKKHFSNAINKK